MLSKVILTSIKKYRTHLFVGVVALFCALGVMLSSLTSSLEATEKDYFRENGYLEVSYNMESGLDTDATNAIAQTRDGFIWIGSYNGLARYDGVSFYNIPASENEIYSVASLYVDSKDRLWIGTNDSGVAMYKNGKYKFWKKDNGLTANNVRSVCENEDGVLFIGTSKGLSTLEKDTLTAESDTRLQNRYIHRLVRGKHNRIVGITKRGDLFIYKGKSLENFMPAADFTFGTLVSVIADAHEEDTYWVGTAGNIIAKISLKDYVPKVELAYTIIGKHAINDMRQLSDGGLMIACDNGAGYVDVTDGKFYPFTSMKFNSSLDTIMLDYENNVWFTSSRQGVSKLTKNRFRNIFAEADIKSNVVNAVTEYDGMLFIATDSGLNIVKNMTKVTEHPLLKTLPVQRIRHLNKDSQGNLWLATYSSHGLVKYSADGKITEFNKKNGLLSDRVRVSLESSDGKIYVGTRDGLSIINNDKVEKNITVEDGLGNAQVLCLLERQGRIYAGTDGGGITVLDKERIVDTIDERSGLKNGVILRMTPDPNHKGLWISTGNSIAYFEDGMVQNIDKFPSNNNFDFIFTENGAMLVTCNKGIYVTKSEKLRQEASDGRNAIDQLLTHREGLSSSSTANSFNYQDSAGNLYLCLQSGLDCVNVNHMLDSDVELKVTVPCLTLDGVDTYFDATNTLKIASSVDKITFKGYVLTNRLDDAYLAVKLDGYDKDYVHFSRFSNKELTYTNLNGGTYKLRVGVYNRKTGKVVNEKVYTLVKGSRLIEYSGWFAAAFVLIVLVSVAVYRYYMRKKIDKAEKKAKETQQFLDEVIDSFAKAIDIKDHYTRGHSDRVAQYSRLLALEMGMTEEQADEIYRIGKLHDVGKVVVPLHVLNKNSRLTDEEYGIMKKHTDDGADILTAIKSMPRIAIGARTHHERYDGKGYGHHLAGEAIPLEGRIIAVADTFDAMNSTRVYRPHLTKEKILSELEHAKGTQLDAKIVDAMLQLISEGKIVIEPNDTPNK